MEELKRRQVEAEKKATDDVIAKFGVEYGQIKREGLS